MLGNFMKRAFLAIICGAALMASTVASVADVVSDKEMAERYSQAAQSGDTDPESGDAGSTHGGTAPSHAAPAKPQGSDKNKAHAHQH